MDFFFLRKKRVCCSGLFLFSFFRFLSLLSAHKSLFNQIFSSKQNCLREMMKQQQRGYRRSQPQPQQHEQQPQQPQQQKDKRSKLVVRNLPSTMTKAQFLDCVEKVLEFEFGRDFSYFDFMHGKTTEKAHVEELMSSSSASSTRDKENEDDKGKGKEEEEEEEEKKEEENASSRRKKTNSNSSNNNKPKKVNTNATALIDLCTSTKEPEMSALIGKFVKAFDGAPFQVKGETSRAKVEFALNQRVPFAAQQKKKEDGGGQGTASVSMQTNAPSSSSAIFKDADFLSFKKTFDANGGRRVASRSALRTGPAQPRDEHGKDNVKISALVNFVAKKRHSEQAILDKERKEEERKRLANIAKKKKKKNAAGGGGGGGGNGPGPASKGKKSGTVRGGHANPPPEEKKKAKKKKSSASTVAAAAATKTTTPPAPKPPGNVLQKNKNGKKEKKPTAASAGAASDNNTSSKKKSIPIPKPKGGL